MYVDDRVGDKPNETDRERERERERERKKCVCIRILDTSKEKRQ